MNIKPSDIKLPSSYRRVAQIDIQLKMQEWVTVAAFNSSTQGHSAAYALSFHGSGVVIEVTRERYAKLVKEYADSLS